MKNNQHYIDQGGVTIVTPIKPSADLVKLYQLLGQVNKKIYESEPLIDLKKVSTLHYIRFIIVDRALDADGNKLPDSLILSSNFDGPLEDHLDELVTIGGKVLKEIYSYCEGFPSQKNPSNSDLLAYLNKFIHKNPLFWPAFRGGTVEQIKGEYKLVEHIQKYIDNGQVAGLFSELNARQIQEKVRNYISKQEEYSWAVTPRAKPSLLWNFKYWGKLVLRFLVVLALLPLILPIGLFWWLVLSRIFERKDDRERKPIIRDEAVTQMVNQEDRIYQNQLTIYGTIKKPRWFRLTTLKIGLFLFSTNGGYRSTKGKLSGIETIHFARWSLFNNQKNVLFLSNYDGPWQIYLSQFIDNSAMAMNLTFSNMVGYPKTKFLVWGGAFDEQKFKTVVRNNQYPSQIWYSAYPYFTIKNILHNNEIRKGLDGSSKETADQWLNRL